MVWLGLLVGAFSVGVSVDVGAGAPACPWPTLVPSALARLDTLEVQPEADVRVAVAVRTSTLTLDLQEGPRRLATRVLPVDGACEARADGVALVVEQQLRALGYVPSAPPPAPSSPAAEAETPPSVGLGVTVGGDPSMRRAPSPSDASTPRRGRAASEAAPPSAPPSAPLIAPTDAASPAGADSPRANPARASSAPAASPPVATSTGASMPWTGWIGAGGYLEIGSGTLGPRGGGRLALVARRGRFAGLFTAWGLAPASTEVVPGDATRGKMTVWTLGATVGGEACFDRARGAICGQLRVGVERVRGSSAGELLFGEGARAQVRPIFVGAIRYRYPFLGRFAAWLAAEGVVRPSPSAFSVEDAAVVEDPGLALGVALGVSAKVF